MKNGLRFAVVTLIAVTFAGLALHVLTPSAKAADNGALLTGTVKSAQGENMAGVTVSAKMKGSAITTTGFTDKDGSFYFPRLADGNYRVWAQAVGYDEGQSEMQLAGSIQHQDFTLNTLSDFSMQLTGDRWLAAIPEDNREDRRMKEILRLNCVGCHTPAFALQNRFDEKGWEAIITLMSRGPGGSRSASESDVAPMPAVNYFKPELAAFLAKMRGPGPSPMKFSPRPRPTGESALAVVTEYNVALVQGGFADHDGSDWTFGTPGRSGDVHDTQIDFNGNIWFTDWSANLVRTIGKVDGKTGVTTNFKIPNAAGNGYVANAHAIVRDDKGIIWFNVKLGNGADKSRLARLDPNTEKIDLFEPPAGMPTVGDFLDWDGIGNIWMAAGQGNSRLGLLRFDPTTQKFTYFKAPFGEGSEDGHNGLYGVAADSHGNGWFSLFSSNMEATADGETGKVTAIKLPRRPDKGLFTADENKVFEMEGGNAMQWGQPWVQGPRRPGADKHGDFVWVPGWWSHTLLKIDINTSKVVAQYQMVRPDGGPYMAQVDKDHMVWINYEHASSISKFDPKTEKWTEYNLLPGDRNTPDWGLRSRWSHSNSRSRHEEQ